MNVLQVYTEITVLQILTTWHCKATMHRVSFYIIAIEIEFEPLSDKCILLWEIMISLIKMYDIKYWNVWRLKQKFFAM